jgi:hypothetical protein
MESFWFVPEEGQETSAAWAKGRAWAWAGRGVKERRARRAERERSLRESEGKLRVGFMLDRELGGGVGGIGKVWVRCFFLKSARRGAEGAENCRVKDGGSRSSPLRKLGRLAGGIGARGFPRGWG